MASSGTPSPSLNEDTIDDLIYLARAGELEELKSTISSLATEKKCLGSEVLSATVDTASGNSLLHYPAANGNVEVIQHLLSLLPPSPSTPTVAASSILNHKNTSGNTALHWAALNGHLEVAKALVEAGADPGVMNSAGRDAIVEAEMSGKPNADKCAVWILEHWAGAESSVGAECSVAEGVVNGESNGTATGS